MPLDNNNFILEPVEDEEDEKKKIRLTAEDNDEQS